MSQIIIVPKKTKIQVQDSIRETALAKRCELMRFESRNGPDASDRFGNHFELKTTTKGVVSTARDLGPKHLERWRPRCWIVARGDNFEEGFQFDEIYFLAPVHMEAWYQKLQTQFDLDEMLAKLILSSLSSDIGPIERKRAAYLLARGRLLNDPGLPWTYVRANGILIPADEPAKYLPDLVARYPQETIETDYEPLISVGNYVVV